MRCILLEVSPLGNSISTTGPIICEMKPVFEAVSTMIKNLRLIQIKLIDKISKNRKITFSVLFYS